MCSFRNNRVNLINRREEQNFMIKVFRINKKDFKINYKICTNGYLQSN